MSDWQPITTAPKDGTKVLLWIPKRRNCYRRSMEQPEFYPARVDMGYWYRWDSYDLKEDPSDKSIMRKIPKVEFEGWTDGMSRGGIGMPLYNELNPTHWQPLPNGPHE